MKINYLPIVLVMSASILAAFVGLPQKIIWAFIAGFIGTDTLQSVLDYYLRFGFGPYSFFVSFAVGMTCALIVHSREAS